jgi:hypothetical protein
VILVLRVALSMLEAILANALVDSICRSGMRAVRAALRTAISVVMGMTAQSAWSHITWIIMESAPYAPLTPTTSPRLNHAEIAY